MEIHAPHQAVRSLKDFAMHIAIVTIGILIALSLEGLREAIRDRRLVTDARANFRAELELDKQHIELELAAVKQASKEIQTLAAALPELAKKPGELNTRLTAIRNPGYFLILHSWQTALSTGALSHMSEDEVGQYAGAENSIVVYSGFQGQTLNKQDGVLTFFESHPNPTPQELRDGTERLLLWSRAENTLAYLAEQTKDSINAAYGKATR